MKSFGFFSLFFLSFCSKGMAKIDIFKEKPKANLRGCDEIVITDCDRNYCDIHQTEPEWPSAELCQLTCQIMGENTCQSWAYNSNDKLCDLYGCPISQWLPTCKQIGGPADVDLGACLQQDSGCDAFKRGHCNFGEENVLANVAGNFQVEDCQYLCSQFPGCVFFHTDEHFCTLFSAKVIECDGLAGPPTPKQASCSQGTTTTPEPTTGLNTVCARAVDVTTNSQISNVYFKIFQNGNLVSNGSSSNGEVCKNSLPSGTFLEINATKSGYDFGSRSGYVYDDAEWIIPMNPRTGDDRVVLTWGTDPRDLDLHLHICNVCEVYYSNKNCPGANLDVDDQHSFGPETITVKNYQDTKYLLFVEWYSGGSSLPHSAGRIDIRPNGNNSMSVNVPNGENTNNRFWFIGSFNGNEGLSGIEISNTIVPAIDFNAFNCEPNYSTQEPPTTWDPTTWAP